MKGELSNLLFRGIKCKYCKKKQIVTTRTQFLLIYLLMTLQRKKILFHFIMLCMAQISTPRQLKFNR